MTGFTLPAQAAVHTQDCLLCGAWSGATLCGACRQALPHRRGGACRVCDLELAADDEEQTFLCGACLADAPHFDATVSAFDYRFPVDRLMQSYKFSANLALVEVFAVALAERIRRVGDPMPDCIVPMPLGRRRLAERGFNQAALLAHALGKSLAIASRPFDLLRVRETAPQSGLSRARRLQNVKGAFACDRSVESLHIALVDDVMTTGATLSEGARALKKAGAARVDAWVVARVMADAQQASGHAAEIGA